MIFADTHDIAAQIADDMDLCPAAAAAMLDNVLLEVEEDVE
jgi:hypothetical protein